MIKKPFQNRYLIFLGFLLTGIVIGSCQIFLTGSESSETDKIELGRCVYNQAYQENYAADNIDQILEEARDCYVLVDPFAEDGVADVIPLIQQSGNQVGCYVSVGTGENWRNDFSALKPYLVEKEWTDWDGEFYIREITPEVISVMETRIENMADWGCDWVEFDNMDWALDESTRLEYQIEATEAEAVSYYQGLCALVHQNGMLCMAKSTAVGAADFDGITVESSRKNRNWWGHDTLQSFMDEDKLAIIVHYKEFFCQNIYADYQSQYDGELSFICEDRLMRGYRHFNQ